MSAEEWPAPATEERPWITKRLRFGSNEFAEPVTVREVRLWGKWVLIDESDRVYCRDCWDFVEVAELASPANGHAAIGLPYRADGIVLPAPRDPNDPRDGFRLAGETAVRSTQVQG